MEIPNSNKGRLSHRGKQEGSSSALDESFKPIRVEHDAPPVYASSGGGTKLGNTNLNHSKRTLFSEFEAIDIVIKVVDLL